MKSKLLFCLILFLLMLFTTMPTLADGVNKPKKSKIIKKSKSVKKVIAKIKKPVSINQKIRAIVRNREVKAIPPFISTTKPRIPFQVNCSEGKYIIIKTGVASQASALLEGQKISEASFHQNPLDEWAGDYNAMIRVARLLNKAYEPEFITFKDSSLIFIKSVEEINFSLIFNAFKNSFPDHEPFEILPRYGCGTTQIAIIKK